VWYNLSPNSDVATAVCAEFPTKLKQMSDQRSLLNIALRPEVVKRAVILAVIVGGILIGINHGTCIVTRKFNVTCLIQSGLTFFVPYAVSTISSVMAINCQNRSGSDR